MKAVWNDRWNHDPHAINILCKIMLTYWQPQCPCQNELLNHVLGLVSTCMIFFFSFAPMWPQVRLGSQYTSTCRMGQWMRLSPTCHAVRRRTVASWRVPHANAPCCGANSSVGRSTDSSSTSPHTEEEESTCWSSGGLEPLSGRVEKKRIKGQRNAQRRESAKLKTHRSRGMRDVEETRGVDKQQH